MINGHGGNIYGLAKELGCKTSDIIDMSSNVNPLGPPPGLITFLKKNFDSITSLPEVDSNEAVCAFSKYYNISKERILAGNGTTQFIYSVPKAIGSKRALILGPTYSDYEDGCIMHDVGYEYLFSDESSSFFPDLEKLKKRIKYFDTVFICNPNNPTGTLIPKNYLESLFVSYPDKFFIIDESYMPFVKGNNNESLLRSGFENVLVLNSMSKIFGIPGLRIGFLIASKENIGRFLPYYLPWSVNSIAQAAVCYLMDPKNGADSFIGKTVNYLENERIRLIKRFKDIPEIKLFPSTTSFILCKLDKNLSAEKVCPLLSLDKILIRNCSNFKGLSDNYVRISLKTYDLNSLIYKKLSNIITPEGAGIR